MDWAPYLMGDKEKSAKKAGNRGGKPKEGLCQKSSKMRPLLWIDQVGWELISSHEFSKVKVIADFSTEVSVEGCGWQLNYNMLWEDKGVLFLYYFCYKGN